MGVFSRRNPEGSGSKPGLTAITGGAYRPTASTPAPRTAQAAVNALPFTTHRTLTAAASIVDVSTAEGRSSYMKRRASSAGWQEEAWLYFDAIGEISYAFTVVANAVSRVRLYAAELSDQNAAPVPVDPDSQVGQAAIRTLNKLSSAFGGIPGLLRDAALNLQTSGECLLVQRPANPFASPPIPESWDIRSVDEIQVGPDGNFVIMPREDGDKSSAIYLPKNAYVARIWRPHPRYSDSATSSMRAVLDSCAELMLLNKTFRSTARSRLNSGLLYLPDGLSVAASGDPDAFAGSEDEILDGDTEYSSNPSFSTDLAEQDDIDEFEEALLEAMTTPIADEESASAVVPLIVRGPSDLGEKIKLIQFERTFDPALAERAERLLDRIMQGLDVPKEVVKGLSSLKFSTAQVVDLQLSKAHVEPLALVIVDALTTAYLKPALRQQGFSEEEIENLVVWFDPSEVSAKANRSEDSEKGFDNYLISGEAWRKAHAFTEDDAPTSTELAVRLLIDKGQITPELAESLLSVVAPDIMEAVRNASQAANPITAVPDDVEEVINGETPAPEPPAPVESEAPATPATPSTTAPTTPADVEVLPPEDLV